MQLRDSDLHPHLKQRMEQRGITLSGIEDTLDEGWEAPDVKPGMLGKTFVFKYETSWEGKFYEEKEITVYYKYLDERMVLLTVKARYGKGFPQKAR